jgi:peptidoglycan/LPS O-acetylase OafA/YrhL
MNRALEFAQYSSVYPQTLTPIAFSDIFKETWKLFVSSVAEIHHSHMMFQTWTLVAEFDCSIWLYLFVMVYARLHDLAKPPLLLAAFWVTFAYRNWVCHRQSYLPQLSSFILGFMIAELKNRNIHKLPRPILLAIKFSLLAVILSITWMPEFRESLNLWHQQYVAYPEPGTWLKFFGGRTILQDSHRPILEWTMFAFAFVLLAELSETIQKIFSLEIAVSLGKASFGLYILHLRKLFTLTRIVVQATVPVMLINYVRDLSFSYNDMCVKQIFVVAGTFLCTIPPCVLFYYTADASVPKYINPIIKKAFDSMEYTVSYTVNAACSQLSSVYSKRIGTDAYSQAILAVSNLVKLLSGSANFLIRRKMIGAIVVIIILAFMIS